MYALRLNGNGNADFSVFSIQISRACTFFFEYRAVLMHVNYPLWPSGHLLLQRCALEHLISATNTKTVTSEKEKDHFYWEIWECISRLLLRTASLLHCWAWTGNTKHKHVLTWPLHSSLLRQTTQAQYSTSLSELVDVNARMKIQ